MAPIDPTQLSFAQLFELPEYQAEKQAFFADLKARAKTDKAFKAAVGNLKYDWQFNARPKQKTPSQPFTFWLVRSGRGFGKTRTGAEWIREKEAEARKAGTAKTLEMAICNKTYTDLVEVNVKAILDCYPASDPTRPEFINRKLVWKSGAICYLVAAQTPDQFRGKNLTYLWIDELAKFLYPQRVWEQARLATRRGNIQILITTTPSAKAKDILKGIEAGDFGPAVVTYGSSYENTTNPADWTKTVLSSFVGTRLGAQEIYGKDVDYASGALWKQDMIKTFEQFIEEYEQQATDKKQALAKDWSATYLTQFKQVVVAVDPAATATIKSDETGIIVAARDHDGRGFILEDLSGRYSPDQWAGIAVKLFHKYKAKCIVAEKNQGGDMISSVIHHSDPKVPVQLVHASKGKLVRAEPVARLYEQGRIYHLDNFNLLEDQLCNYTGIPVKTSDYDIELDKVVSPDRMDALVWALSYLFSDLIKSPARGKTPFRVSGF